jgi:hypothetical protein
VLTILVEIVDQELGEEPCKDAGLGTDVRLGTDKIEGDEGLGGLELGVGLEPQPREERLRQHHRVVGLQMRRCMDVTEVLKRNFRG